MRQVWKKIRFLVKSPAQHGLTLSFFKTGGSRVSYVFTTQESGRTIHSTLLSRFSWKWGVGDFIFYVSTIHDSARRYPIATFDAIWPYLSGSNPLISGLIVVAMVAILILAFRHFYLLAWNIGEYRKFKRTAAFASFKQSNAEVSTMAIPLTVAMSINVGFVLGGVFVPGLWNIVEYLFPFALLVLPRSVPMGCGSLWIIL